MYSDDDTVDVQAEFRADADIYTGLHCARIQSLEEQKVMLGAY